MDALTAWLTTLGAPEAAALAAGLTSLPGRPPHGDASVHPTRPLAAMEWSVREGDDAVRWAYNLAAERVHVSAVASFLSDRGSLPSHVATAMSHLQGAGLQVGAAGSRTKLYAYPGPQVPKAVAVLLDAARAGATLHRALGGLVPTFAALDLDASGGAKVYVEAHSLPVATAAAATSGAPRLAALGATLDEGLGTPPARWVLSLRAREGAVVDRTLHVKLDAAPERLAELAGPELSTRAASLYRRAARLRLRLLPTYVSFLDAPERPLLRTVYYRLVEPR
ncbi:MAG: hypothetical protein EXR71_07445 [Myxococcales bacterium]|nr:hypothetical protein [Myxococcales bacterium]